MLCLICQNKSYIISEREDGLFAVEHCSDCWRISGVQFDEDAAALAREDGIECCLTYPCYIELTSDIVEWLEFIKLS